MKRLLARAAFCCVLGGCGGCGQSQTAAPGDAAVEDTQPASPDSASPSRDAARDTGADTADAYDAYDETLVGWHAVPGGEECGLYEADLSVVSFPKRVWKTCGAGCLVADVGLPGYGAPMRYQSSGTAYDGESYLRFDNDYIAGAPIHHIMQVARVSDGVTVAAVQQRRFETCDALGGYASPFQIAYFGGTGATLALLFGHADKDARPVQWQHHWLLTGGSISANFDWRNGFGMTFPNATVTVVTDPDATDFTVVDPVRSFVAVGWGEHAFWSTYGPMGNDIIRGFGPGGSAPVTFVAHDARAHAFGLSDDALVWVGTHGPSAGDGTYSAAELYWSPMPNTPADVSIHRGPSLPWKHGFLEVSAGGDFASTYACNDGVPCDIGVVQLSTSKLWTIHRRPGNKWVRVMSTSGTEVIVGEIDDRTDSMFIDQVQRLVRLDVTQLDALAAAW